MTETTHELLPQTNSETPIETTPQRRVSLKEFLIALLIIVAAWAAKEVFGLELNSNDAIVVTDPDSVIQVMFTSPKYPDADEYHVGGIDERLSKAIDHADTSVYIAAFEFDLPLVADALIDADKRDVDVRIVTDSDYEEEVSLQALLEAGIPVVFDERESLMHNKFVVIDGNEVWTGSWNLTGNGTYRNNNNVVVLRSQNLAVNYTQEFEEMFTEHAFGPTSPADIAYPSIDLNGVEIEIVFEAEGEARDVMVELIRDAKSSVYFMAFVFTDDDIADAMIAVHQDGVDVAGIIESRSASITGSEFEKLNQAGIEVLRDGNPYVLHHKVIIIDKDIVITGSYNFSNNAAKVNDENVLFIHSPELADAYIQEYQRLHTLAADPQRMALIESLEFPESQEDY